MLKIKAALKIFFVIILIEIQTIKSMENSTESSDESSDPNLYYSQLHSNKNKSDDLYLDCIMNRYPFCFDNLKMYNSNINLALLNCMINWMCKMERESWYTKFSPDLQNELKDLLINGEYLPAIDYSYVHKDSKKFKMRLDQTINRLENIKESTIIQEVARRLRSQILNKIDNLKLKKLNFDGSKIICITENGTVNLLESLSNELLRTIKSNDKKQIKQLDLTPDDKVIIAVINKKELQFFDVETGDLLQTLKFENKILFFGLNKNGTLLGIVTGPKAFIFKRDFDFLKVTYDIEKITDAETHNFLKKLSQLLS